MSTQTDRPVSALHHPPSVRVLAVRTQLLGLLLLAARLENSMSCLSVTMATTGTPRSALTWPMAVRSESAALLAVEGDDEAGERRLLRRHERRGLTRRRSCSDHAIDDERAS